MSLKMRDMQKTLARHEKHNGDTVIPRRDIMSDFATVKHLEHFGYDFEVRPAGGSLLVKADCFEWLKKAPANSLHAIVTDPPYGVKEYDEDQLKKREDGRGGVWRIPPAFDGHQRSPLPRFTALDKKERQRIVEFFTEWGKLAVAALRPGAHLFIATNTFMSQLVYDALVGSGFEFRGEIIRLVQTLRGGDRPKNAEKEFPDVCSMPRGCFEPWGLFRKSLPARMTVGECLRQFETGGLRRLPNGNPFKDVIPSEKTPRRERQIANHPSLKPQSFLRQIVYVSLPLGKGILADPFMGSGSTVAAAEYLGMHCIGLERDERFFAMAEKGVPALARIEIDQTEREEINEGQLDLLEDLPLDVDKSNSLPSSRIRFASHLP
jgi:site-specific DNA-methyltransferase (adenine-specific)